MYTFADEFTFQLESQNNFVSAELLEGLLSTIVRKRWVF